MNIEMTPELVQHLKDSKAVMGNDPNNMPERTVRLIRDFIKDRSATGRRTEKKLGGKVIKKKKITSYNY